MNQEKFKKFATLGLIRVTGLVVVFSLSGCFYQSTDQYDIQDAIRICGSSEKIADIAVFAGGREEVTCMDSSKKDLHKKLKE